MGRERAHAKLLGDGEGLAIATLGHFGLDEIAMFVDLAQEPERPRLVAALLPVAGEGEDLLASGTPPRRGPRADAPR